MDAASGAAGDALTADLHPTVFIAPGAHIIGDVSIAAHSSVWYNAVLRGDNDHIHIGESTNLQDGVIVHVDEGVPCHIGDRVGVGHRAVVHGCTVESESLVGMGVILLNGVRVGAGSVIGAGAVVPENMEIPPGSLVVGVPARVVRPVDNLPRDRITRNWQHYVALAERQRR